eukprot:PITA_36294
MKEAVDSEDGKLWKETMVDEMVSLHKNKAWDLVELLAGRKAIGSKWVFKKKKNAEGKVEKYKARFVEKGYSRVPGIDFGDIFSPVAKDSKPVKVPIFASVKLSIEQCPKTQEEEEDMSHVPYVCVKTMKGALDNSEVVFRLAGDLDQRRSSSGYVLNVFGGAVSWMSKKQSIVALSTIEAEYMAATYASKEAVWLQRLCSSMGLV